MLSWIKHWKLKKLQTKAQEVLASQGDSLRGVAFEVIADPNRITCRNGIEVPYIAYTAYEVIKTIGFTGTPQRRNYAGCSKIIININSINNIAIMRDENVEEFLLKILTHIILCIANNCDPTWYDGAVA